MKKRYVTYFGIPIPPFKEEKLGAGATPIRFVLTGKMPSKKNNQQSVTVRKYARSWANEQAKHRQPSWADVHKAETELKWKAELNLESMLASAWRWEKSMQENPLLIEEAPFVELKI